MSHIEVRQLVKQFGSLTAVDHVDLDVDAGEVVCLLGPSGCGKTTTLRMIAGLEFATAGDILLGGKIVNDLPARARNVAMTFQFYALYPSLSVADNIAYPLHAEAVSGNDCIERVRSVAERLQLTDFLSRRPHELAEGEKQRVAVARSIVREPTCFLFDEPLSRLDAQLRESMRGQIKEVLTGLNKPTVIVTHDQVEALSMADRIAVMRDGAIEQVASPYDIFEQPANLFVAGFIGTPGMNLLSAHFLGQDQSGNMVFALNGRQIALSMTTPPRSLAMNEPVTIGIRPRRLQFTDQTGANCIEARVDLSEPMGAETLTHLAADGLALRIVHDYRQIVQAGDTVGIAFDPDAVLVFGEDGDKRT